MSPRSRRFVLSVAGVAALAAATLVGAASVAAGPAAAASGTWQTRLYLPATAARPQSAFVAVSALTAGDVWAAGDDEVATTRGQRDVDTLEHLIDGRWHRLHGPTVPGALQPTLSGITALADDDVWVSGAALYPPDLDEGDFVAHWDGAQWTVHELGVNRIVRHLAVFGSNDVWALGSSDCCPGTPSYAHWDGTSWTTGDLPGRPTGEPNSSVSAGWATAEDPSTFAPELLRFVSGSWQVAPSPQIVLPPGAVSAFFQDVLQNGPDDVWATVGFAAIESEAAGLQLWHWNGQDWSLTFSRANEAPFGLAPDGSGGLWILSAGLRRHAQFLHVLNGHVLVGRLDPAVVDSHPMQIAAFTLLPSTTHLFAVGESIVQGNESAVAAEYQP